MSELKPRAQRITKLIEAELKPEKIVLRDDSRKHAHHAGRNGVEGDETHFALTVSSPVFSGLTRIQRHRLVNTMLAAEFETGLHALSLTLSAPDEAS